MWTFKRAAGQLISPTGQVFPAYSGHGEGVNNPTLERVKDVGPLPAGVWIIGELIDTTEHGPDARTLTPDTGTNVYGRSGFLAHGDEVKHPGQHLASLGCLITERDARLQMSGKLLVV